MTGYEILNGHQFYRDAENYRHNKTLAQVEKGMKKWKRPFNPDEWNNEELAAHLYGEMVDAHFYGYALIERLMKQEKVIKNLKQNAAAYQLQLEIKDKQIERLEARL